MTGLNTSSSIVNGQLVPSVRSMLYAATVTGPVIQGVPASPPQSSGAFGGSGMSDNSAAAAANPWNPVQSPVPWLILFGLVGFMMLKHVHWG